MSKPIRILQVVTQMHRAGLETMLMNYYRNIDRDLVQFDFLVHRDDEYDYDREIEALGGHIYHVRPITPRNFMGYLDDLSAFFSEHSEYKIVHAHLDALSAFVLRAAKRKNVPVRIAHSHNTDFDKDSKMLLRYFAKALIPLYATHFMGCSKPALKFMFGEQIANGSSALVLPNAIDLTAFSFSREKRICVRENLGIDEKLVIGHIGRFGYQKNHEFLIDIFAELYRLRSDAVLLLIGDGEDKPKIEEKVRNLGLEGSVRFLGVRNDIPDLLSAMDLFVMPSWFEGFVIVLLEAQMNGLPAIASNTICSEINVSERLKFMSLEATAFEWAQMILSIDGRRYDAAEKMRVGGFDIRQQAKKLEEYYCRLYNE